MQADSVVPEDLPEADTPEVPPEETDLRKDVTVGPSGLLMLAGLFAYEQLVLLWLPLLLSGSSSPSSSVVMQSLVFLLAAMMLPIVVVVARDKKTPTPRRRAMIFCVAVATATLFITNSGDVVSAVGMVAALLLSEVMLVLQPQRGVTSRALTAAYVVTIAALYLTVVWGPVMVASFSDEGTFVRPGVPGLISWYVVHVWALIGLGRTEEITETAPA